MLSTFPRHITEMQPLRFKLVTVIVQFRMGIQCFSNEHSSGGLFLELSFGNIILFVVLLPFHSSQFTQVTKVTHRMNPVRCTVLFFDEVVDELHSLLTLLNKQWNVINNCSEFELKLFQSFISLFRVL